MSAAELEALIPRRDPERRTRLLGILNVTPDSFHDGGVDTTPGEAAERGRRLVEEGADALDVGAESTRPGASSVSERDELDRLLPVLAGLRDLGVPISVDTTKARVASRAVDAGASIINDISGLQRDPEVASVCAETGAALVLMHMRGDPSNMRGLAHYVDVVDETIRFLGEAVEHAVRRGVPESRILVDPGLGFAKTPAHNLEILRRLGEYHELGRPILLGASRKSFLAPFDGASSSDRLEATLVTTTLAVQAHVAVLRVHDVRANRRAILTTEAVLGSEVLAC